MLKKDSPSLELTDSAGAKIPTLSVINRSPLSSDGFCWRLMDVQVPGV
jgi:hypothetical protein